MAFDQGEDIAQKPIIPSDGSEYLLEARNIVKTYGDFRANDQITLSLSHGKIHALLGENGAGKSTLVKIIYGALQPTSGQLIWLRNAVTISNPAAARQLGIGMVFQHFSLFEALTVAENIALALAEEVSLRQLADRIAQVSIDYGLPLNPDALVADLSVGERQRVEIVRCLLQEPRLLIMDEPTSVLTPQESDQLFLTLQRLAGEGCAVLYISHRLEEVQHLCHDATILRHGEVVARVDPQLETANSLARMMVGADIHAVRQTSVLGAGKARLRVRDLSQSADGPFGVALENIHLDVRAGEVVAIAGIAGNGQSELFDSLSGERRSGRADSIAVDGTPCGHDGVSARRRLNTAFVPEERIGHGAVPSLTLSENVLLTRYHCDPVLARRGIVNRRAAMEISRRVAQKFDVRKNREDPEARSLSGGNLQKFLIGRELDRRPGVLVVNQPTWGVDAGAAALIRQALLDLAAEGAAVMVISQDLDEIFEIADRIAVISRGRLSPAMPAAALDREQIGLLMAGAGEATPPASSPPIQEQLPERQPP